LLERGESISKPLGAIITPAMPNSAAIPIAQEFSAAVGGPKRVSNSVCSGCGCLCDDIVLVVDGGRVVESINACEMGARWFQKESPERQASNPFCQIQGSEVDFARAVAESAAILQRAKAPIIVGLTQTTTETVRIAIEIADKVGAVIDCDLSGRSSARIQAFQRQGRVTATLGEVKNRADVILFWGVDPVTTHPRHAERYSIEAKGRFRENGRADRTILVVDEGPSPTSEAADRFLPISPATEIEILWAMRAILAGKPLRRDCAHLVGLVDRLKAAEYAAIFADATFGRSRRSLAEFEAMSLFVRELNQVTRCVLLPLGGPGNATGAEAALSWQTGFPSSVDLGAGVPVSIPGVTTAIDRLTRHEADLALIIADAVPADLPYAAAQCLKAIPQIVVAPATVDYEFEPTVRFAPPNPFLTSVGSLVRSDGVPLPLRAPLVVGSPSDRDCLRAISSKLDELGCSTQVRV